MIWYNYSALGCSLTVSEGNCNGKSKRRYPIKLTTNAYKSEQTNHFYDYQLIG